MQETVLNNIKEQLAGTKGHFIVKIPKSKYTILAKCISSTWDVFLLDPSKDTVETLKENIEEEPLKAFINNLLNTNAKKINKKSLKNILK